MSVMRIKGDFILRDLAGEQILVPVGQTALRFNGIIVLQPVAAVIWQGLAEGLEKEALLTRILERFEVDGETAARDLDSFLSQLQTNGFIEE